MLHQKLIAMKYLLFSLVLTVLLSSCASTNKIANKSIHNAIIGQSEMVVFKRLVTPTRVEHGRDGGKVMIFESTSKGMFLTPYKSKISYTDGIILSGDKYKVTNTPEYTIYPTYESYLKVYIEFADFLMHHIC